MDTELVKSASEVLKRDEGFRERIYRDTRGYATIGYGFRVADLRIPRPAADMILDRYIRDIHGSLSPHYWYSEASQARKVVLISMAYNLGISGLMKFGRMVAALKEGDYNAASDEMLRSRWASQVGSRAVRLAQMMRTGKV